VFLEFNIFCCNQLKVADSAFLWSGQTHPENPTKRQSRQVPYSDSTTLVFVQEKQTLTLVRAAPVRRGAVNWLGTPLGMQKKEEKKIIIFFSPSFGPFEVRIY
jgi:hypothetical protein